MHLYCKLFLFLLSSLNCIFFCESKTKIACEDRDLRIECAADQVIRINHANYGRTSASACSGYYNTTNCSAENSTEIVSRRCNDQPMCTISASNGLFGNPCANTRKYLEVNYTCASIHHENQELITCQNREMILVCSDGLYLEILGANYGRSCEDQCVMPGMRSDMNCSAANSTEIMQKRCNNLQMCFVNATDNLFGDPCVGVAKYLEVNYTCNLPATVTPTPKYPGPCHNSTYYLHCTDGTLINVRNAFYGREPNSNFCDTSTNRTANCSATNATQIVQNLCNNQETCDVEVNDNTFGRTCPPGVKPYLLINYTCDSEHVYTCENTQLDFSCPKDTSIIIVEANYGRTSATICPNQNGNSNLNCTSSNATRIVSKICDFHQSCSINATSSVFGDSCNNTSKYLEVEYVCPKNVIGGNMTVYGCENRILKFQCPSEYSIKIIHANFGRTSVLRCPSRLGRNTNCHSTNATEILKERCENEEICVINASSTIFGDPCIGTYKYLEVEYRCELPNYPVRVTTTPTSGTEITKVVCEGQKLDLNCGKDIINIVYANYGRTSVQVCQNRLGQVTNCTSPNATQIARQICENKMHCSIFANSSTFGADPCVGVYKYLEVVYKCEDPTATKIVTVCDGEYYGIGCHIGYHIYIEGAFYGRNSPSICSENGNETGYDNCSSSTALEIVGEMCDYKQSCSIGVNSLLFGDPCPNVTKYLQVNYSIILTPPMATTVDYPEPSDAHNETACLDSTLRLSCPEGQVIYIIGGNFGRTSPSVCPSSNSTTNNMTCQTPYSLQTAISYCNGKNVCYLNANYSVFGYDCSNVYSYLEVSYACKRSSNPNPNPNSNGTVCENSNLYLSCPPFSRLVIRNAFYGRRSNEICPNGNLARSYNCSAGNATTIVRQLCAGENCAIPARNAIFGDPCPGVTKYLQVDFVCEESIITSEPIHNVTGCENTIVTLACPNYAYIYTYEAIYGRTHNHIVICPHANETSVPNCTSDALWIVSQRCDGYSSCAINASNSNFGDPCAGKSTYLEIIYGCINRTTTNTPGSLNGTTCENNVLNISCPENYIDILSANYGRTSAEICSQQGHDQTTNCTLANTTEIVAHLCDGEKSCMINASNSLFGDPCFSTYKYLNVEYTCLKNRVQITPLSDTVCEGHVLYLNCPPGQKLDVLLAIYGRLNNPVCRYNGYNRRKNCFAENATQIVTESCSRQENCSVNASNAVFGDPCPGADKYLEVFYRCNSELECGVNEEIRCASRCPNLMCGENVNQSESCQDSNPNDIGPIIEPACFDSGCVCEYGYRRDPKTGICVASEFCPQPGCQCQTHETFIRCGAQCQTHCGNRNENNCDYNDCQPGYVCQTGFVREGETGRCVRPEDCLCYCDTFL